MRRGNKPEFCFDDKGNFIGVALGSDFVSEHEWGIRKLRDAFGVGFVNKSTSTPDLKSLRLTDTHIFGVPCRKATRVPNTLIYKEFRDKNLTTLLMVGSSYHKEHENEITVKDISSELRLWGDSSLTCAWDEGTLGIHTIGEKNRQFMRILHKAVCASDVVVFQGGGGVFENPGLTLVLASALPDEVKTQWYETDFSTVQLYDAVKKTGIEEHLKKSGKSYYALSPRWKDDKKDEIIFWLNPMNQREHNYGWFTVEELGEWAENKGPIMMQSKQME